jgi:subtilisin family serine protease
MSRKLIHLLVAMALLFGMPVSTFAQSEGPEVDLSGLALETPVEVAPELADASGTVEIVVRLIDEPLAVAVGAGAKQKGSKLNPNQQRSYVRGLGQKQSGLMAQIAALGGVELGRVSITLNAVIVSIDAARVNEIAALSGVRSIRPLGQYELDLSETVPYIGAAAVQANGVDGSGVEVAVLDSGIDYTHFNLGGDGTLAAYGAAYGTSNNDPRNTTLDGLFPTAKVVKGYDFVGEQWPNGSRSEDPDPIDFEGHGTHVADIIAGRSADGSHKGVAPGASLVAVKVCSAVASSCNGVALLRGMDFALDPNMDGSIEDAVDVINMSLGSSYGQIEDDLSLASAVAVRYGVVVVASAGNSADRPYISGSPASTPEVISVAQTQVPSASAIALLISSPANIAGLYRNTATVDWAPIGAGFTGDIVYIGRACPGDPLQANPAGKVALADRGTCAVSLKTDVAGDAGAIGVLLANNAGGDAPSFSFGGGDTMIPTLVITQATGNLIKANLSAPVNVTVSPATATSLAGGMAGTSSRGPSISFTQIKPDIGAPGASLSAVAGSGNGNEAFGGTSGAAPMVTGSAALLLQSKPNLSPLEVKARLMNTANTNVYTNPANQPGLLAPITRIGGGEVRVDRASVVKSSVWSAEEPAASLSFGFAALTGPTTFTKKVVLRNYSNQTVSYNVSSAFRYADDQASGAVSVVAPASVRVRANNSAVFNVQLTVDPSKLPNWTLATGAVQGNGALLNTVEFDGYLTITGGGDTLTLPWHVLPRKSVEVTPSTTNLALNGAPGAFSLSAAGATNASVGIFSLLGTSGRIPPPTLPEPGDNYAMIDLKEFGVRQASPTVVQFAVTTFGTRSHPAYPAEFDVYLDTNRDGAFDYAIYTSELTSFGATGQTVVNYVNLNTGAAGASFFADADLRSGNMILTVPMAAVGLVPAAAFDVSVYAFDNYFTGSLTDSIEGMTYTLGAARFSPGAITSIVPAGGTNNLTITHNPANDTLSPSQQGLLLLYRNARQQRESDAVFVTP